MFKNWINFCQVESCTHLCEKLLKCQLNIKLPCSGQDVAADTGSLGGRGSKKSRIKKQDKFITLPKVF